MSARCVGVIGGGAWGTALALAASRAGHSARIWARDAGVVRSINQDHRNPTYLGEVDLGEAVSATEDLADMASCDPLLLVVPAQFLRGIATQLATLIPRTTPVIVCAKGIETKTGLLMTEVAAECLAGWPLAVLSGPSFANEVAAGQPTAVTLAADDLTLAQQLVDMIGSRTFRPYASDDLLGAEVGGAVKKVLAIACGVAVGQGYGDNTRAALISRGLAEMMRFGVAIGARPETLMGLSGVGDLTLTASSMTSRNMSLGVRLGSGEPLAGILASRPSVVEGVYTASAVVARARSLGVEMPICAGVDAVLNQGADLSQAIQGLMARQFRRENMQ